VREGYVVGDKSVVNVQPSSRTSSLLRPPGRSQDFRTLYNPMDNAGSLQLAALIVALARQAYRHARVRFWPKGVGANLFAKAMWWVINQL
ncbi:hypothetical protein, partial [Pseudomonas syringae]|uniref:hypothetical protein n=1 Tax=Pseudomonas syringae TaxID=317 RepID=UPI001F4246F2